MKANSSVPRLWISPASEVVELADGDDGHGMAIAKAPERFGLPASHFDAHLDAVNADDSDTSFDFDAAIALAQSQGWTRTSRDAGSGAAISAGSARAAQRAARLLIERGFNVSKLDLEITRIDGDRIVSVFYDLDDAATEQFVRYGRLPRGRQHEMSFAPELIVQDRPVPLRCERKSYGCAF